MLVLLVILLIGTIIIELELWSIGKMDLNHNLLPLIHHSLYKRIIKEILYF